MESMCSLAAQSPDPSDVRPDIVSDSRYHHLIILPSRLFKRVESTGVSCLSAVHGSCSGYFVSFATWPLTLPIPAFRYAGDVGTELLDDFGAVTVILSWATNVWTTSLISYKAW